MDKKLSNTAHPAAAAALGLSAISVIGHLAQGSAQKLAGKSGWRGLAVAGVLNTVGAAAKYGGGVGAVLAGTAALSGTAKASGLAAQQKPASQNGSGDSLSRYAVPAALGLAGGSAIVAGRKALTRGDAMLAHGGMPGVPFAERWKKGHALKAGGKFSMLAGGAVAAYGLFSAVAKANATPARPAYKDTWTDSRGRTYTRTDMSVRKGAE